MVPPLRRKARPDDSVALLQSGSDRGPAKALEKRPSSPRERLMRPIVARLNRGETARLALA